MVESSREERGLVSFERRGNSDTIGRLQRQAWHRLLQDHKVLGFWAMAGEDFLEKFEKKFNGASLFSLVEMMTGTLSNVT